jgi:heterodisulfide reductase subunit A
MEACENKAIYKEEKYGAVLVDRDKCKGSRSCWAACPYGTPQFDGDEPGTKMVKCNMCIDRLEEGLKPICVLSCGMRALEFGLFEDLVRKYGNSSRLDAEPGYAPCRLACPAEVKAESYITLLSEGRVREAIDVFRETTPFAGVLGRVCTHPCEADCERGKIEQSVSIRSLKRYMADEALKLGEEKTSPLEITRNPRIAIIGSGPGGLSCAYDLIRQGYPVTVFEAAQRSGGMLRYAIPDYRLPKDILDSEITYIEDLGVEIRTGSPVRKVDDVFEQGYKAVFLAMGAWISQRLSVPGENARGVFYAIDFLKRSNSGEKIRLGNKVVVIGGGSVAVDAARVTLRLGAKEVCLICLESRDLTCKDRMLAQDLEIEDAEDEGVGIHPCLGVKRFLTEKGKVVGLETVTCTSVLDENGRFSPKFAEGTAFTIAADTVIVAIGQRSNTRDFSEVKRSRYGSIRVNELTLETNIRGVFAGADVVTGPGNVISAVAQGKQAAASIDRYLRGADLREGRRFPGRTEGVASKSARPPVLGVGARTGSAEVEQGFDGEEAAEQASRCFHCGSTMPCVIFRPAAPRVTVIRWDAIKALELWQKRQADEGEHLPDIFDEISEVTEVPLNTVGRNKLVLKAENSEQLLYYTTDNE